MTDDEVAAMDEVQMGEEHPAHAPAMIDPDEDEPSPPDGEGDDER